MTFSSHFPILLKSIYASFILYSGPYQSWGSAQSKSTGYASAEIFNKVTKAAKLVAVGKAAYERDSVLFNTVKINWPVLSSLMTAAAMNNGNLAVLDFGGSLGTTFFQHRNYFENLKNIRWGIVEQPHFAEYGRKEIQTETVKFYTTLESYNTEINPDIVLFNSVLQYLENPYDIIRNVLNLASPQYIHIDKTPVTSGSEHVYIQHVPRSIYHASYPSWSFNESRLIQSIIKHGYLKVSQYDCDDIRPFQFSFKGYFFRKSK